LGSVPVDGLFDVAVAVMFVEGDIDADCLVGLADLQQTVVRYGSHVATSLYEVASDVQSAGGDDDVDIHDAQTELA
jgi:hypothetical protein